MFHSVTVDQRKRSLDGLSERSIASIGSDPARKNPALGEPWGLVADEPLAVLLEARF
jgi:hypothetical protein